MRRNNGTVSCSNSQSVFYQCWLPDEKPKAMVLLVHGLAEHSGRYGHVAQYLVNAGIGVCGMDLPGHGQSSGTPGHVDQFEHYLEAVNAVQEQCVGDFPRLPLILLGHSMGGLVAANYLLQHQQDYCACVLTGPALEAGNAPGSILRGTLKALSASMPRLGVMKLEAAAVSRDPVVVQRYVNDPLVYRGRISARLTWELLSAMNTAMEGAGSLQLPMLLVHGGQDKLAPVSGSRRYHEVLGSSDKSLKTYPDLFHEVFNEPEQRQILSRVLDWVQARIPQ